MSFGEPVENIVIWHRDINSDPYCAVAALWPVQPETTGHHHDAMSHEIIPRRPKHTHEDWMSSK